MSDEMSEIDEYGKRHLAHHLHEAGKYEALVSLADKQQKRIADLERDNNLLREVFEAAKQVGNQAVSFQGYYTISSQYVDKLLIVTQNAMNGVNVETK